MRVLPSFFFFNDTATTEIYTLSLHDALPICPFGGHGSGPPLASPPPLRRLRRRFAAASSPDRWPRTSYRTLATPLLRLAIAAKAARVRSMHRPATNGPRSLIRTIVDLPLARLVTRTRVLNGSVLCAAVKAFGSKTSPLAVRWPSE